MNRDDIIRMARDAGYIDSQFTSITTLERFAGLVAAEREACQRVHDLLEVHQAALEASEKPGPWPSKEVIDKAVAAEREACARVCEETNSASFRETGCPAEGGECAAAIRARSKE